MGELVLKKSVDWGYRLVLKLPCLHEVELLPEWFNAAGVFKGRLMCSTCRATHDSVRLEGWPA